MKVGIVGCGNLGLSLLKGIHEALPEVEIVASKRHIDSLQDYANPQVTITSDNARVLAECDILLVCLKPFTILPFLEEFKDHLDPQRHTLVSCATGIRMEEVQE